MSQTKSPLSPSPDLQLGYCTNVHAGTDLQSIRANLTEYAVRVRERLFEEKGVDSLGVGLWIPDQASRELVGTDLQEFISFLQSNRLEAFTINGFPYANFHGDSVKQRVYLPAWDHPDRFDYTKRLASILAAMLPEDRPVGSISTLPIGWPDNPFAERGEAEVNLERAGIAFRELSADLEKLHKQTGRRVVVAIEPEPGCVIDTVGDMVDFFDRYLPETRHRQYITVCHDICHSAVMNEPQRSVIAAYAQAGIEVGKVQVSSAIVADWKDIATDQRGDALSQLGGFAEDRYLHQTGQVAGDGGFQLAEDLPDLIAATSPDELGELSRWVIHFHVPIFLQRFGLLTTTRDAVLECLNAIKDDSIGVAFTGHFEVETYAWTVLPPEMRQRGLAEDIASEMSWLIDQLGD